MIDDEDTDEQSKDKEHASLQPSIKQDEEHARINEEHIVNNAANQFETDNSIEVLVNITTVMHVSIEIQNYLLNSVDFGQGKLEIFVKSTLSLDKSNYSFYSPIKRTPFANMKKKTTLPSKSGNKVAALEFVFR